MPIHPHECRTCGGYEVITASVTVDPDPACPKCGKTGERRFGVPSYKTDAFRPDLELGGGQFANAEERAIRVGNTSVQGKRYMESLANYPGDPEAWVSDMAEAKALIRKRGWGAPDLGIKAEVPELKAVKAAPDIVMGEIQGMVDREELPPKMPVKKFRDVFRDTQDKLTPSISKKWAAASKPKERKRKVKVAK